jgi:hypothetical protein
MRFRNAKSAISWAENRLNRSGVKSTLGSLQKTAQTGTGDLSAEELDDVAQTVTHIASNISKPKGTAMMAIYGLPTPSRDWALADIMELFCRHNRFKGINNLNTNQLKNFMLLVIADVRFIESGENMKPKTAYYDLCGLNAHKWKKYELYELRGLSQTMLQIWIEDAARALEVELDAIDMLDE